MWQRDRAPNLHANTREEQKICTVRRQVAHMKSKEEFLQQWMNSVVNEASADWPPNRGKKDFSGAPTFYAFVDMDYFILLSPISWASASKAYAQAKVTVPRGFVTDFASVPRVFWSLMPPIGRYGYAALFHDFVYWQQVISRTSADRLLFDTMKELQVPRLTSTIIYGAVRVFGFMAWRANAAAKSAGERRLLREFPTDITTRWLEWKARPGVFV
jgi:hypothetical protein